MKIDPTKLRASHEASLFALDFLMLGLIVFNLAWLIFDTFFESQLVQQLLSWALPQFTAFYANRIHPDFVVYDLVFVALFLSEFCLRWMIAIHRNTYHRWFFYPFVHWYDLIGCIPVGSFRWLRLLRVVSIVYRLQKYQIIDISNTFFVKFVVKYFNVLMEEVSDRVVINVLNGVQDQIATGNPVVEKVMRQVLLPHKTLIIEWVVSRINDITDTVYQPRREDLRGYLDRVIADSIEKDAKVAAIDRLPVIGAAVTEVIESTVSDIVFNVVDQMAGDIGRQETDVLVHEITDLVIDRILQPSDSLNIASKSVLIDVLEVVKDEVKVQRWKLKESMP